MNRRSMFHLLPFSMVGIPLLPEKAVTESSHYCSPLIPSLEPLSFGYNRTAREMLTWIRETQSENLLEASYAIARTIMNGGTCWYTWDMGHSTTMDLFPGRNGMPVIFTEGYDPIRSKPGDLFLNNVEGRCKEDIETKGVFMIGAPCPWGSDARWSELIAVDSAKHHLRPYSDLWIETNITTVDAVIKLPGMPAPFGPFSGILGMVTFWMMVADTCRILARDGNPLPVEGDERTLDENTHWENLNEPLMGKYFDEIMKQLEMIIAELGNCRQIAKMVTDSVLNGGHMYVYSRRQMSLCVEGFYRRGGLALSQGIYYNEKEREICHYDGSKLTFTKNDSVIMGITKPDDEIDLICLDYFRKKGMNVASLGPLTRDMKIPAGRTIPKETDVHVGRMCDTYGLFAIPGFTQKVCPTSGAVVNQIFWMVCMEIAEEILRRTGNAPGVLFSSAIKDGQEHNTNVYNQYKERGY